MIFKCGVCECRPVRLSYVNIYASFRAQQAVNGLLSLLWKTENELKFSFHTHTHNLRTAVFFPAEREAEVTLKSRSKI